METNLKVIKAFATGVKSIQKITVKHAPTVLTGVVVGGVVILFGLTINATKNSAKKIDAAEKEKGSELTPGEKLSLVYMDYIPPVTVAGLTIAAAVSANAISARRLAALAGLCSASERVISECKDALGEGNDNESNLSSIFQNKEADSHFQPADTLDGELYPCIDSYSGRKFWSNKLRLKQAAVDFNQALYGEMYKTLNEAYDYMGLEPVRAGYDVAFTPDSLLEFRFGSTNLPDGTPALLVDYVEYPKYIHGDSF